MKTPAKSDRFRFVVSESNANNPEVIATIETANNYIEKIRCAWSKSAEAIIETGRLLNEAKANLHEWTFQTLVGEKLPFSRSWAFKLMKIARDPRLTDVSHAKQLPPRAETLYLLTTLDADEWKAAKKRNLIRPDVERREIEAVRQPKRPKRSVPLLPAPSDPPHPVVVVDADPVDHGDEALPSIPDDAQRVDEQHEVALPKLRKLPGKPLIERLTRGKDAIVSLTDALDSVTEEARIPAAPEFGDIGQSLLIQADRIRSIARRLLPRQEGDPRSIVTQEEHVVRIVKTFDPGSTVEDLRRWIEDCDSSIDAAFASWLREERLTPEQRTAEKDERVRGFMARVFGGQQPEKRPKKGKP